MSNATMSNATITHQEFFNRVLKNLPGFTSHPALLGAWIQVEPSICFNPLTAQVHVKCALHTKEPNARKGQCMCNILPLAWAPDSIKEKVMNLLPTEEDVAKFSRLIVIAN